MSAGKTNSVSGVDRQTNQFEASLIALGFGATVTVHITAKAGNAQQLWESNHTKSVVLSWNAVSFIVTWELCKKNISSLCKNNRQCHFSPRLSKTYKNQNLWKQNAFWRVWAKTFLPKKYLGDYFSKVTFGCSMCWKINFIRTEFWVLEMFHISKSFFKWTWNLKKHTHFVYVPEVA